MQVAPFPAVGDQATIAWLLVACVDVVAQHGFGKVRGIALNVDPQQLVVRQGIQSFELPQRQWMAIEVAVEQHGPDLVVDTSRGCVIVRFGGKRPGFAGAVNLGRGKFWHTLLGLRIDDCVDTRDEPGSTLIADCGGAWREGSRFQSAVPPTSDSSRGPTLPS